MAELGLQFDLLQLVFKLYGERNFLVELSNGVSYRREKHLVISAWCPILYFPYQLVSFIFPFL